jgi:hypothetical protein
MAGLSDIADCSVTKTLTLLDLSENSIGMLGAEILLSAIKQSVRRMIIMCR